MAMEHALIKNGSIVRFVWTFFISLRRAMSAVASISSENVKDGIVKASVIVFVMAFFIPEIFLTLSRGTHKTIISKPSAIECHLLVLLRDALKRRNPRPSIAIAAPYLLTLRLNLSSGPLRRRPMATLDESQNVSLGDSTIFARARDLVDVDAFLLGEVPDSWS